MDNNQTNRALHNLLAELLSDGKTREASIVIDAATRIAAGPELLNSNHITQVGRSELGLHGGQQTKMWENFGPVLGWFRPQSGPSRGVPIPQLMPGESMTSFIARSQKWLQQYAAISGQQGLVQGMQQFFTMMQQPGNMQQLEAMNHQLYQEFDRRLAAAQALAKQKAQKAPVQAQQPSTTLPPTNQT